MPIVHFRTTKTIQHRGIYDDNINIVEKFFWTFAL